MRTVAIDCDLHKLYAVCDHGPVFKAVKAHDAMTAMEEFKPDLVLFEIASPVDYSEMPGRSYNKRRWMIYNIATAMKFHLRFNVLVSPSSSWTHGYDREMRHKLAGCKAKQKDMREAEAMLWFYAKAPTRWMNLDNYLEGEL